MSTIIWFFYFNLLSIILTIDISYALTTSQSTVNYVRLVGGSELPSYEGRIEVYYESTWVSVSQNGWSKSDAIVACRQLGFVGNIIPVATRGSYYGEGKGSVALTNIGCLGNESSLMDCPFQVNRRYTNGHYQDAGLRCVPGGNNTICQSGSVRLVNTTTPTLAGRVDVCIGNVWGTIVRSFFDHTAARVICRQLGYYTSFAQVEFVGFPHGKGPISLSRVSCTSNEDKLLDCKYNGPSFADDHSKDVGVYCYDKPTTPNHCSFGDVRLVYGKIPNEGTIELCIAGVWGSIVDDGFDNRDASVICRQLGYSSDNALAYREAHFGQGTGPLYLKFLKCRGMEDKILDCPYKTFISPWDTHSEDAGVRCEVITQSNQSIEMPYSSSTPILLVTPSTVIHPIIMTTGPSINPTVTTTDIAAKDRVIIHVLIGASVCVVLAVIVITLVIIVIHTKFIRQRSTFTRISNNNHQNNRGDILLRSTQ